MTRSEKILTPTLFASRSTGVDALTLKARMAASQACACATSPRVTAPTPRLTTLAPTVSFPNIWTESRSASAVPWTSPLTTSVTCWNEGCASPSSPSCPCAAAAVSSPVVFSLLPTPLAPAPAFAPAPRLLFRFGFFFELAGFASTIASASVPARRCSARSILATHTFLARSSDGITCRSSPAVGAPLSPAISAGSAGPIRLMALPEPSRRARTLPNVVPTAMASPTLSSPLWRRTLASTPCPRSTRASTTVPTPAPSCWTARSSISASRRSASSSSRKPCPFTAATSTHCTVPPTSSSSTPSATSACRTRCGCAVGRSHLVTAITTGTCAARACASASRVCGMTPSSAATTTTATSVTAAPRARIALNAA
mmetsp:Transcript_27797/g.90959  ORF Transcript_27797/g.90959 Transcript_27797/m.90959 type:complete len:371 (+) Transcript_27797:473-1585(+)